MDTPPARHQIATRLARLEAVIRGRHPDGEVVHCVRAGAIDGRVRWFGPGYYWRDDPRADWSLLGTWPAALRNAEQLAGVRRPRPTPPDPDRVLDLIMRILTLGIYVLPRRSKR